MFSFRRDSQATVMRLILLTGVGVLVLLGSACSSKRTEANELSEVKAVVLEALQAWRVSDWTKMYKSLASGDKQRQSFQVFREERERLFRAQRLLEFEVIRITRKSDVLFVAEVSFQIEEDYNSGYRPSLEPRVTRSSVRWAVVKEQSEYKITFLENP